MSHHRYPSFLFTLALVLPLSLPVGGQGVGGYASASLSVPRAILRAEPVRVSCPAGFAPTLPSRVWVSYTDGSGQWRQVRWTNATQGDEAAEADSLRHPVGSQYEVVGYVVGDETTASGYPVKAVVSVGRQKSVKPQVRANGFLLSDVTINGNNRLTHNRDEALRAICSWDVMQQLYNYRDTYGLSTEGYRRSDGWDSPDTKLKGHGSGHYMSAIAQAYAVTKDPKQKAILRLNITRMVNELRACQEKTFVWNDSLGRYWEARDLAPESELKDMKGTWAAFDVYKQHPEKYGYGYLNAIPAQHCLLIEKYSPYNNSDGVWAPYYSIHKQLAGLIDIATYFDDKTIAAKALLIAKDMGLWVWNRLHYRTYVKEDGTQAERRAHPGNRYEMWDMYIAGEVGGMQESLSRLSEMVSSKDDKAKLLEAARCFDAPKFYDPLSRNIDDIRMRHANQHIPMIIGALRLYQDSQRINYYHIADNFWNFLQGRYVYATGGVGNGEMFRQPYSQVLSMATNGWDAQTRQANPDLNETCCSYNLLKLTQELYRFHPNDARYMDYYERTLYNHIVGSLNPERYQTTYQYAVGLNATKPFDNETPQSTCCGGTGSENHTKYQSATYFSSADTLWVCQYMPTTLQWRKKGVVIRQLCQWPAQRSTIEVVSGKASFTMKLRVPGWATSGFAVKVNGRMVQQHFRPCSFVELDKRHWKRDDRVEVVMPYTKYIEYGVDKLPGDIASADSSAHSSWTGVVMYGPLAMTGTGVTDWKEATLNLDTRLDSIVVNNRSLATTAYDQAVPSLCVDGKMFLPDYYRNAASTHYYRIHLTDVAAADAVDRQPLPAQWDELSSLLAIAYDRQRSQEAWKAMDRKVPEYAPWAPYGYERLQAAVSKAQDIMEHKAQIRGRELEETIAALNKAVNTMRPGNLAETEELAPLNQLMEKVRTSAKSDAPETKEALNYAERVVRYVTDGSGTSDMIASAMTKLKKVLLLCND